MYANIYAGMTEQQATFLAVEAIAEHEPYARHCDRDPTSWSAATQPEMEEDVE